MKRRTKKWITLMLAGACTGVCATSLLVANLSAANAEDAAATGKTYTLQEVFNTSGTLDSKNDYTYVQLANGQDVHIKRDLAFKWQTAKGTEGTKYFSMKFAVEELNFDALTFTFESASSIATDEEKATNAIEFTHDGTNLKAAVINADTKKEGATTGVEKVPLSVNIGANASVTIEMKAGSSFDSFKVVVGGVEMTHEFTNIGANFAEYQTTSTTTVLPLEITAKTSEDKKAGVFLQEINGQGFALNADKLLTDNVAPVLVVNEELSSFQYGTAFALDYTIVDVLQNGNFTDKKEYYQYNPTDSEVTYKTLDTSVYFLDTVYYTNGTDFKKEKAENYSAASVLAVEGSEFVSVKLKMKDDATDEVTVDLAWYTKADALKKPLNHKGATAEGADYIVVDKNTDGPIYQHLKSTEADGTIVDPTHEDTFNGLIEKYQVELDKKAADVYAGSNSSISLPAMDDFVKDNADYRTLKFVISYKTPTSSTPTASSRLSYNALKLTTTSEGTYEYKVLAYDAAGNGMKYWLDGKRVELTSDNIWDIEDIPSFTFTIKNQGIKVNDPTKSSDRKAEKILDQTYTLSGLKVVGSTNEKSEYKLYRFDDSAYKGTTALTESHLTNVTYEAIADQVKTRTENKFDYLDIYAELLASSVAVDGEDVAALKDSIKACFKEIKEYNANITEDDKEWEEYNKYNWNPSSKSFKTVEEGKYLIVADFWEDQLPTARAGAYKLVVVESEEDVIKGASKFTAWVKNNVVSVVLFAIAGVMLIAIIVLLLVKPSDETLEDVDAKVVKKKKNDDDNQAE